MFIKINQLPNAEDNAMLQALYSRSFESVEEHLKKVDDVGSGSFMSKFYIGYGHESIGDCGTTTVYIEGVSHLVAKAFQDNPLYSGQESSTRYNDYSNQKPYNPLLKYPQSIGILEGWMNLYDKYNAMLHYRVSQGHAEDSRKTNYLNTVKAKVFDMVRGFLPTGSLTQFSWHTNIRQARTKLISLLNHPLEEVRIVALTTFDKLSEKYPNSFGRLIEVNPATEISDYYKKFADQIHYSSDFISNYTDLRLTDYQQQIAYRHNFNIEPYKDLFYERPKGAKLPVTDSGTCSMSFDLDFGSFRDLQRHRNGVCKIPRIFPSSSFSEIYIDEISKYLSEDETETLVREINSILEDVEKLGNLVEDKHSIQYFLPMGIGVEVELNYSLAQMIYVSELRSRTNVHFSLRPIAMAIGDIIKAYDSKIACYTCYDKSDWDLRRGKQTITEKS